MNVAKELSIAFAFSLLCWYYDILVSADGTQYLNAPLGGPCIFIFFPVLLIYWWKKPSGNFKFGRVYTWIAFFFLAAAISPPMMDFNANKEWLLSMGLISYLALMVTFFLARWILADEK